MYKIEIYISFCRRRYFSRRYTHTHTRVVIFRGLKRLRPNQLHICNWLG